MDFEMRQLITDCLNWQVANHDKGEDFLAAWKEVFTPEKSERHSETSKHVTVRKNKRMKSLALFFDKGDASTCVPVTADWESDITCVNKEFSSLFEALKYMTGNLSNDPTTDSQSDGILGGKEEPREDNSAARVGTADEASTLVQADNDDCSADNTKKRELPSGGSSSVSEETAEPSAKKMKVEVANPATSKDVSDPEGNKDGLNPKDLLWLTRFCELEELWAKSRIVYQQHIAPNPSLLNWVKQQRKRFKLGKIRDDRIEKLESIGFQWVGRNSVVLSDEPQDEAELGALKQGFADNAAKLRRNEMDDEKQPDAWQIQWNERFEELLEYKQRFGDTRVPKEWPENRKLAGWVRKQREQVC